MKTPLNPRVARHFVARPIVALPFLLLALGTGRAGEAQVPPRGEDFLSTEDTQYLADFGEALRRFQGMALDEFLREYGPRKNYADGDPSFIRGETNGDGNPDIADGICILGYLFLGALSPCALPACLDPLDIDDNGRVEISDPIHLLTFLYLGGPPPAAPFPGVGRDPTADGFDCPAGDIQDYDPLLAENLELIQNVYPLSDDQRAALRENGFAILKDRKFPTFLSGLDNLHFLHLPVYLSADALLDALHLSFDRMLMQIESLILYNKLDSMLAQLEAGLAALEQYSGGRDMSQELDDLAFWICTARSLLLGEKQPCVRAVDDTVNRFLNYVASEKPQFIEIFGASTDEYGEPLKEDFSQFRPRGHYTRSERLKKYFRAMMWIQRIRFMFPVSPRHAAAAYLLTKDLLDNPWVWQNWKFLNEVIGFLVGFSDSLNPEGMERLAAEAGIGSVADFYDPRKYRAFVEKAIEIGAGKQMIMSQIYKSNPTQPDGFTPILPTFHFLGQRFIVDSFVFTNVVKDRVPNRDMPSPLDAWFVLGNRATVPLLKPELELYRYHPHLAALDWIVSSYPAGFWDANQYNIWLSALKTLSADTTSSRYPAVMSTRAWDHRMLNTQLASWAHLRHDTILYAKPSYGGECDYPDGWVDPYPEFFEKLATFAEKALLKFTDLGLFGLVYWVSPEEFQENNDLQDFSGARLSGYFENLANAARMLKEIAQAELDGFPLSTGQTIFIKSLLRAYGEGCDPRYYYSGWYPALIYGSNYDEKIYPRLSDYFADSEFRPTIADVHTSGLGSVLHVGVGHPNLMVITVKNDCGVKAYAGPVLSYHELVTGDFHRLTDEEWKTQLGSGTEAPRPGWTAGFIR